MELGLRGRNAIVCASSRGLGRACAVELARAGCRVVINGRDADALEQTASHIRMETGADVEPVTADLDTVEGRDALLAAVPTVDILVNNNGGPPLRDFREVDRGAMVAGIEANMFVPIELVQRVIDGMVERRFGRIINVTSSSVKMPLTGLDLSTGARIGLTGFLAGVARSVAHANVTINFLLPGAFDTRRLRSSLAVAAKGQQLDVATIEERRLAEIPARRFGQPSEFGAACAYLCSAQAGFITGQSLLIDGGAYPGVF